MPRKKRSPIGSAIERANSPSSTRLKRLDSSLRRTSLPVYRGLTPQGYLSRLSRLSSLAMRETVNQLSASPSPWAQQGQD